MKQRDWTKQMRDRLIDYKADVPDNLWPDIENALQRKRHRTLVMRRYALSAAAVVAAFVIVGTAYMLHRGNPDGLTASHTDVQTNHPSAISQTASTIVDADKPLIAALSAPRHTAHVAARDIDPIGKVSAVTAVETQTQGVISGLNDSHKTEDIVAIDPADNRRPSAEREHSAHNANRNVNRSTQMPVHYRGGNITIEAYSSNMMSGNKDMQGAGNVNLMSDYAMTSNMLKAKPMGTPDVTEKKKHYMPLTFGVSVGYALNDRVALSSGLVYTRTVADFTSISVSKRQTERQTLHYVGIPLNVDYRVWSTKGLKVYATAGVQADVNVSASSKKDGRKSDIDTDRMQWSVGAAAGVEYDFVPKLGVYVEPGVKYYIDNGSSIDNVFKDKPCNFSLQIGLRYNLK